MAPDKSYEDYLNHQRSKQIIREQNLTTKFMEQKKQYEENFTKALIERLKNLKDKSKVLCLAARSDAELKAFEHYGCEAIGIDAYPAQYSSKVIKGDFHFIEFDDATFDVVYTNSIDHSIMPHKLCSEAYRVLKNEGIFILEFHNVEKTTSGFGAWECFQHKNNNEIVDIVNKEGFNIVSLIPFEVPWLGVQGIFKKNINSI